MAANWRKVSATRNKADEKVGSRNSPKKVPCPKKYISTIRYLNTHALGTFTNPVMLTDKYQEQEQDSV